MSEKFGLEKKDQPNFSKICLNLMNFHEKELFSRCDYLMKVHEGKLYI